MYAIVKLLQSLSGCIHFWEAHMQHDRFCAVEEHAIPRNQSVCALLPVLHVLSLLPGLAVFIIAVIHLQKSNTYVHLRLSTNQEIHVDFKCTKLPTV